MSVKGLMESDNRVVTDLMIAAETLLEGGDEPRPATEYNRGVC